MNITYWLTIQFTHQIVFIFRPEQMDNFFKAIVKCGIKAKCLLELINVGIFPSVVCGYLFFLVLKRPFPSFTTHRKSSCVLCCAPWVPSAQLFPSECGQFRVLIMLLHWQFKPSSRVVESRVQPISFMSKCCLKMMATVRTGGGCLTIL